MSRTVLLFTVDSLRADRVGATTPEYAKNRGLTPNIDEIADRGVVCTNAFATGPGTRQSFPGILGSTPPLAFGGYNRFSEDRPAIAERMQQAGYSTYGVHSNAQLSEEFGYDRGFHIFDDGKQSTEGNRSTENSEDSDRSIKALLRDAIGKQIESYPQLYRWAKSFDMKLNGVVRPYTSATETRKQALSWLDNQDEAAFLWVHFMDVHVPYYPPKRFREEVDIEMADSEMGRLWLKLNAAPNKLMKKEIDTLEKLYDATVKYVDYEIGQLLSGVKRLKREDPIIGFASDHGDEFREHDGLTHSPKLYNELIHVPLIFDLPEFGNGLVEYPTSTMDIAPTILRAVDGDTEGMWGEALQTSREESERAVFSEVSHATDNSENGINPDVRITACRTNRWTYIKDNLRDRVELYDRQEDPLEQVRCEEEYPEVAECMAGKVSEFRNSVDETSTGLYDRKMSSEIEDRLKKLGYLDN